MRVSIAPLAVGAALVLAACGARVTVGFVDAPDAGGLSGEPPPFAADAARREPGCADKGCGDFCTPCDGDASTCAPPSVFHVCSSEGLCLPEQPGCVVIQELDGAPATAAYVPCAGLACAAACTSCDPTTSTCPSPTAGNCQGDGACAALPASCQ